MLKQNCCICGDEMTRIEETNNPYPVMENGRCCGVCNMMHVVPARLEAIILSDMQDKKCSLDGSKRVTEKRSG